MVSCKDAAVKYPETFVLNDALRLVSRIDVYSMCTFLVVCGGIRTASMLPE